MIDLLIITAVISLVIYLFRCEAKNEKKLPKAVNTKVTDNYKQHNELNSLIKEFEFLTWQAGNFIAFKGTADNALPDSEFLNKYKNFKNLYDELSTDSNDKTLISTAKSAVLGRFIEKQKEIASYLSNGGEVTPDLKTRLIALHNGITALSGHFEYVILYDTKSVDEEARLEYLVWAEQNNQPISIQPHK